MKAGIELDILVSEKVLGIFEKDIPPMPRGLYHDPLIHGPRWPKRYSTDISAAMEVIKRLDDLGFVFSVNGEYSVMNNSVIRQVRFLKIYASEVVYTFTNIDEMPLAICLAALKVVTPKEA